MPNDFDDKNISTLSVYLTLFNVQIFTINRKAILTNALALDRRYVQQYALQHFEEVIETEEFLLLSCAQLIDLISPDELDARDEHVVYNSVLKWVRCKLQQCSPSPLRSLSHSCPRVVS